MRAQCEFLSLILNSEIIRCEYTIQEILRSPSVSIKIFQLSCIFWRIIYTHPTQSIHCKSYYIDLHYHRFSTIQLIAENKLSSINNQISPITKPENQTHPNYKTDVGSTQVNISLIKKSISALHSKNTCATYILVHLFFPKKIFWKMILLILIYFKWIKNKKKLLRYISFLQKMLLI